jgi:hypothetical protein
MRSISFSWSELNWSVVSGRWPRSIWSESHDHCHRRLVEGGRGIGVVFEELGRPGAVVDEVEAAVEGGVVAATALGDQVPGGFGNAQSGEEPLVGDHPIDEALAECGEDLGRILDVAFDLLEGEGVMSVFDPIGFAADLREAEVDRPQPLVLVGAGGEVQAPHHDPPWKWKEPIEPKPPRALGAVETWLPDDEPERKNDELDEEDEPQCQEK